MPMTKIFGHGGRNIGKRFLAVLLVAVLVCSAGPMGLIEANATDVPTGYTPIYTAQDLDNIRKNLTGYYYLMNDIDLASWGNWEPIGTYGEPFQGILLGNGQVLAEYVRIQVERGGIACPILPR